MNDGQTIKRPEHATDEHLKFLDNLRETGAVNMFGAAPELRRAYDMSIKDARAILYYWMDSYDERHPAA